MLGIWYPEFVHVHGINETMNNNHEDAKQKVCFKYYLFNYKNMAYENIQPEAWFGKL